MPFLRAMVKGMEEKDFRYLIAGYILVFGVLPCLEFCLWKDSVIIHESFNPVLFMTPNVFYALAGYYLEHVTDHQKNRRRRIGRGIGLTAVALATTIVISIFTLRTARSGRVHTTTVCARWWSVTRITLR